MTFSTLLSSPQKKCLKTYCNSPAAQAARSMPLLKIYKSAMYHDILRMRTFGKCDFSHRASTSRVHSLSSAALATASASTVFNSNKLSERPQVLPTGGRQYSNRVKGVHTDCWYSQCQ